MSSASRKFSKSSVSIGYIPANTNGLAGSYLPTGSFAGFFASVIVSPTLITLTSLSPRTTIPISPHSIVLVLIFFLL